MNYLFYDDKGRVGLIWKETPPQKLLDSYNYMLYEGEIPEREGFITITKVNLQTKEVYFEYEEISDSEYNKIQELETQVNALNIAMAEIMGV